MRVSTAFNRLLQIPGAWVTDVVIDERDVEVTVCPKAHRLQCPCGMLATAVYDRRRRRWRHLDLGRCRLWLVYEIRRLQCPDCGIRTEELPWARSGARHTRTPAPWSISSPAAITSHWPTSMPANPIRTWPRSK